MSKRKDAVALFDLINKGQKQQAAPGLNVPGWFSKRAPAPPAPGDEPAPDVQPPEIPPSAPAPAYNPFSTAATGEPIFQASEGRVKISLNYVACSVTALGLIVVLGLMFYIGRVSVRGTPPPRGAPPPTDGSLTSQVPYRPGVGGSDGNTSAVRPARIKGKYYLIIDRMKGRTDDDLKDAEAAADYCNRSGYPCLVAELGAGGAVVILSLKPFDSKTAPEAQEFVRAVEALGKNYRPPAGRGKYSFSQHHGATLDPSWRQEP